METILEAGFFNGLPGAYSWCVYLVTVLETPQSIGFTVKAGREEKLTHWPFGHYYSRKT